MVVVVSLEGLPSPLRDALCKALGGCCQLATDARPPCPFKDLLRRVRHLARAVPAAKAAGTDVAVCSGGWLAGLFDPGACPHVEALLADLAGCLAEPFAADVSGHLLVLVTVDPHEAFEHVVASVAGRDVSLRQVLAWARRVTPGAAAAAAAHSPFGPTAVHVADAPAPFAADDPEAVAALAEAVVAAAAAQRRRTRGS